MADKDEVTLLDTIRAYLEQEGYTAQTAVSPPPALAPIKAERLRLRCLLPGIWLDEIQGESQPVTKMLNVFQT